MNRPFVRTLFIGNNTAAPSDKIVQEDIIEVRISTAAVERFLNELQFDIFLDSSDLWVIGN